MALVTIAETLILAVVAIFAVRATAPAPPPYGRRLLWIGWLLALQLGALLGFVAIQSRLGSGITYASPPGLVVLTQLVRLSLLLVAGRAWVGIMREQLSMPWQRWALAAGFIVLWLGPGGMPWSAAILLFIVFQNTKWFEDLSGWWRAGGLVLSVLMLVALTLVPYVRVAGGQSEIRFAMTSSPWPPALVRGGGAARAELALARPLDRMIQAIVDLLRLQLLVLTLKFMFLPIRLSGMSLKRRFWFNYVLVRSIPSLLSGLAVAVMIYLAFGYSHAVQVRGALEQTLARAATAARALADDPQGAREVTPARLDLARRWMSPDADSAYVVVRGAGDVARATAGTPRPVLDPPLSVVDTSVARGLYVRGGRIYLVAVQRSASGTTEVWVPVDSTYLARTMRAVGGNARLTARPRHPAGSGEPRFEGDTARAASEVTTRCLEPASEVGGGRVLFFSRLDLPSGPWLEPLGGAWRGGVELYLDGTPRSLVRSALRALGGLPSSYFLILILLAVASVIGTIEGFAVRSGRSIVQAVLDEVGALRKAADELGEGHLDYRLPVKGRDEFAVVASSLNDMAASLERQRRELIATERLEEDLAVARQIQQRFLPQQVPALPDLDVAAASIPSREVGGDLYYWFPRDDGTLGFALGDVSGKSVPAALLMSNVLAALRAQALDRVELGASLERTNRLIIDQIEPGRFVTLFYGEAEPSRSALRYVSAGHNPALLLREGGDPEWLREGGVPLGVQAGATYPTAEIAFAPGDTLIVYSDGVTEAQGAKPIAGEPGGDARPPLFGEDRLAAVARELRGRPARAVLQGVLDAVRGFADGVEQADDITIVVVRRA